MSNEELIYIPEYLAESDSSLARASSTPCYDINTMWSECGDTGVIAQCSQCAQMTICPDGSTQVCIGDLCAECGEGTIPPCHSCMYAPQILADPCAICETPLMLGQGGDEGGGDYEGQAVFTITGITDTTITIYVSGVTTENRWQVICRLADDEDDRTGQAILTYTEDFEYTFTGLSPKTTYAVNVGPWDSGASVYAWIGRQDVTTKPSSDEWSWWSNVVSGALISISADEWNAFCAFINEVRVDAGLSVYSFTKASSGVDISATIVNQARIAISGITGHGTLPATVSPGDDITANFFLQLANAVNAALE